MSTMSTFGIRLKQLRTDATLSQRAVAEALNITAATVSRYETGEMTPTEEVIRNTALLFKVSADFLLGLSDKPYGELAPHIEESIQKSLKELRQAEEDFEDVKRFEELRRDLMRFLVETLVKGGRADPELPELLDKYISEHPIDAPESDSKIQNND